MPYTLNMRMGTQILVKSDGTAAQPATRGADAIDGGGSGAAELQHTSRTWTPGSRMSRSGSRSTWRRGFSAYSAAWHWRWRRSGSTVWSPYTVAQRTNEFGIRVALGAERGHVLRIVFASTLGSVGSGIRGRFGAHARPEYGARAVGKGNSRDPVILARRRASAELRRGDCLRHTSMARVQSGSDDGAALRVDVGAGWEVLLASKRKVV